MQEIKCRVGEPTDSKYDADSYYHRGDPLPQLDHSLCEEIENLRKVLAIKRVIHGRTLKWNFSSSVQLDISRVNVANWRDTHGEKYLIFKQPSIILFII